jgi:hypothetical protein
MLMSASLGEAAQGAHNGTSSAFSRLSALVFFRRRLGCGRYRHNLPNGIMTSEEAELLIRLNAKLARGDRAWAQWLVAAVAVFAANGTGGGNSIKQATDESLGRLVATSSTRFGRGIAQKIRRALGPLNDGRSMDSAKHQSETPLRRERTRPRQIQVPKAKRDKRSTRRAKARCAVGLKASQGVVTLSDVGFGWSAAAYLPAMQRSHFMNFTSAPVGPVPAPCR